jgi:hypothetical protein
MAAASFNLTDQDAAQRDAFAERLFRSAAGVFDIFSVYLGDRLGFYRALAEGGPLTSAALAARTATHERYAREWLEQQAVAGILVAENPGDHAAERRFRLPPGHAEALVDAESLNYLAPLARQLVAATRPLDQLLAAYRSGGGVPFDAYGRDMREGQADMNRTMFLQLLGREWLPAIPDVHARLQGDPPARVADLGCGAGWSSIGIAQAYPNALVDGYDLDAPSIALASANAQAAGVADRATFQVRDAGDKALAGRYDLVTAFECVHDMADPVGALRAMRRLAGERGTVLIVDERVGETFTPACDQAEALTYGWSLLHCLAVGMADPPAAGTGAVMRPGTLRGYAIGAGFRDVEVLPIDTLFFRFYRLLG